MQIGSGNKPYDEINITPMLDLAYVLLVIFILMATATVAGIRVELPKAQSAVSLESNTRAITVTDAGEIYYEAFPVTLQELEARLRDQQALTPDFPIVVRGDTQVAYGRVIEVLDLLRQLELTKVGLITGRQTPAGG